MVHHHIDTPTYYNGLTFCDKQDHDLDEEQERLTQRRQRVKDVLEGAREYIISRGAIEEKVTQRWEKP
jgi:hypothetical protein